MDEAIANMKELAQFDPWWIEEPTNPDDVLGHKTIREAMRTLEPVNLLDEQEQDLVIALVTLTNAAALYESSELPRSKKVTHAIDEAFMSLPFELRKLRQLSTIGIGCADEMVQSHIAIERDEPHAAFSWARQTHYPFSFQMTDQPI